MLLILFVLLLAALLAAANGVNDAGKPVATLAGSGIASYRAALIWGTATAAGGAALSLVAARALTQTFASGFLETASSGGVREAAAASLAAGVWVLLATRLGWPVSTTHSVVGGLVGAGLASGGLAMVKWAALGPKVFVPLGTSPLVSALLGAAVIPLVRRSLGKWKGSCVCVGVAAGQPQFALTFSRGSVRGPMVPMMVVGAVGQNPAECVPGRAFALKADLDLLHWLSAGMTSFARGLNDAPKIAALALPALIVHGNASGALGTVVFFVVAAAMASGSMLGGRKIARVLGERVTRLDHGEGFAANVTTTVLVLAASWVGLPVSTTHVATGAIAGVGMAQGRGGVSWATLREIVISWIVTLPVSALLGGVLFLAVSRLSA